MLLILPACCAGLDDEALADYLFNLAMLCAEPAENELVVRPVLSLPTNSEEQQQYQQYVDCILDTIATVFVVKGCGPREKLTMIK